MARVYLNLKDLKPVQLASKAQFVVQKMRASNYCDNPPISYQDVDAKIELLMNYIIQEDLDEKGATKNMNKLVDVLEHILKTYVEYVQNLTTGIDIKTKYLNLLNQYNKTIIAIEYLAGNIN